MNNMREIGLGSLHAMECAWDVLSSVDRMAAAFFLLIKDAAFMAVRLMFASVSIVVNYS